MRLSKIVHILETLQTSIHEEIVLRHSTNDWIIYAIDEYLTSRSDISEKERDYLMKRAYELTVKERERYENRA